MQYPNKEKGKKALTEGFKKWGQEFKCKDELLQSTIKRYITGGWAGGEKPVSTVELSMITQTLVRQLTTASSSAASRIPYLCPP